MGGWKPTSNAGLFWHCWLCVLLVGLVGLPMRLLTLFSRRASWWYCKFEPPCHSDKMQPLHSQDGPAKPWMHKSCNRLWIQLPLFDCHGGTVDFAIPLLDFPCDCCTWPSKTMDAQVSQQIALSSQSQLSNCDDGGTVITLITPYTPLLTVADGSACGCCR